MLVIKPDIYDDFKCIAEKCTDSCCVGWEIDVDARTMEHYRALTSDYGKRILKSIDQSSESPHFLLGANEACPHLNECGLCNIILHCGEESLCDICREHPRFYNDTPLGKEVGVGMACEEACRLILTSDGYADICEIGELDGEAEPFEFDPLSVRADIYSILADDAIPYLQRLDAIKRRYVGDPSVLSDAQWRERLTSLEFLDEAHREMFMNYTSHPAPNEAFEKPLERILAYFVYRQCTTAWDMEEFVAALGFSLLCERLIASIAVAQNTASLPDLIELARIVSEEIEYSEENTEALKEIFFVK